MVFYPINKHKVVDNDSVTNGKGTSTDGILRDFIPEEMT